MIYIIYTCRTVAYMLSKLRVKKKKMAMHSSENIHRELLRYFVFF